MHAPIYLSSQALKIATERHAFWEYPFFAQLIDDGFKLRASFARGKYSTANDEVLQEKSIKNPVDLHEFVARLQARLRTLVSLISTTETFDPYASDVRGNTDFISALASKFFDCYDKLAELLEAEECENTQFELFFRRNFELDSFEANRLLNALQTAHNIVHSNSQRLRQWFEGLPASILIASVSLSDERVDENTRSIGFKVELAALLNEVLTVAGDIIVTRAIHNEREMQRLLGDTSNFPTTGDIEQPTHEIVTGKLIEIIDWLTGQKCVTKAALRDILLPLDKFPSVVIDDINERALDSMGELGLEEVNDNVFVNQITLAGLAKAMRSAGE